MSSRRLAGGTGDESRKMWLGPMQWLHRPTLGRWCTPRCPYGVWEQGRYVPCILSRASVRLQDFRTEMGVWQVPIEGTQSRLAKTSGTPGGNGSMSPHVQEDAGKMEGAHGPVQVIQWYGSMDTGVEGWHGDQIPYALHCPHITAYLGAS